MRGFHACQAAPRTALLEIIMKRILLTQGQSTIVDDADFEWLNQWKWHATFDPHTRGFYAVRGVLRPHGNFGPERMHRQILGLKYRDKRQSDHKNHDTLDNRRGNLRIVSSYQNRLNRKDPKGFSWRPCRAKYEARINIH